MIVDDHDIVCQGLKSLLSDASGIEVISTAHTGEDAVKQVKEKRPDVILMDVRMPGIGGYEATRKLLRHDPELKIVILTVCGEEPFPSKLLQAGAVGYLTKGTDVGEMLHAIRAVHSGKRYLGPDVAQQLALKTYNEPDKSPFDALSERELQVMIMVTRGEKVQEISDKLCLSPKTVNSYRYRLFDKLAVTTDVGLTHLAMRHGMLDEEASH